MALLAIDVALTAVAVATEDEEDCRSCKEINGGGEDGGEADTDSTSELSLLSDL